MSRRRLIAALTVLLAALAWPALATAPRTLGGLRDARYCEIIEIKGQPPSATATVWNTIGLNRCPDAQWKALDAGALARELGDSGVVLNGPRHFLMDSVTARPGVQRSFHGLRTRKVATVAIRTAADLDRTPYTDRVIERDNVWSWKKGRTVFELVAPGGDVYVMQSYAQIADPSLTLAKLGSLGGRLELPAGWRYRKRKLTRALLLGARGAATVAQDDLQNTYQLASTTRQGRRVRRAVDLSGRTKTVPPATEGTLEDHGTVSGSPFGNGRIVLVARLADGVMTGSFRLTFATGSVAGTVRAPYTVANGTITFDGTGRFAAGTGAFRGVTSGTLHVHDTNTLDGQNGALTVAGSATY
jgi:hypothetical protein